MLSNEEFVADNGDHCPNCGSPNVVAQHRPTFVDRPNEGDPTQLKRHIACLHCGSQWNEMFKLTGYNMIRTRKNK